jgi:hypothetical protein
MFIERRNAPRRVINRVAQYYCGAGELPRTCIVTDISDTGARLYSEMEMPHAFILVVSGEGISLNRECRVMWRLGNELGVAFADSHGR